MGIVLETMKVDPVVRYLISSFQVPITFTDIFYDTYASVYEVLPPPDNSSGILHTDHTSTGIN